MDAVTPLLSIEGLSKTYPGVRALDGVDLHLFAGEVHALLGENGAGKSTLIKVLTGVTARDAGRFRLDGVEIAPANVAQAAALGIGTVYQEVNLAPNLSVADNLLLGRQPMRFGLVDRRAMRKRAREIVSRYGLDINVATPLGQFSVAVQQIIAIARAVDLSARVLILDEPTASLDQHEVELMFGVLRALRDQGMAILFVTHFLDQVYAISDRITVLRNGRLVAERMAASLPRLELVQLMLGRELSEVALHRQKGSQATGETLVSFSGFGKRRYLAPFDLSVRRGEIVGVAGLLGSGRTETAKLMFGIEKAETGSVSMAGRTIRIRSPRDAIRHGFGYLPEERKTEGIVGALSVRENIVLALQARRGWLRRLPRRQTQAIADRYIKLLDIRTPDSERPIQFLSGGNQQKALLARWLVTEPQFLILDEPTRGIDVGAHAEIIRLIEQLCADGLALLVISSELEEITAYSDRIVILRDRAHIAELAGDEISTGRIMTTIAA